MDTQAVIILLGIYEVGSLCSSDVEQEMIGPLDELTSKGLVRLVSGNSTLTDKGVEMAASLLKAADFFLV